MRAGFHGTEMQAHSRCLQGGLVPTATPGHSEPGVTFALHTGGRQTPGRAVLLRVPGSRKKELPFYCSCKASEPCWAVSTLETVSTRMSVTVWSSDKYSGLRTDTSQNIAPNTSWNSFRSGGCGGGKRTFRVLAGGLWAGADRWPVSRSVCSTTWKV